MKINKKFLSKILIGGMILANLNFSVYASDFTSNTFINEKSTEIETLISEMSNSSNKRSKTDINNEINNLHIEVEEYFKSLDKLSEQDIEDMEYMIDKLDELDLKKIEVFEEEKDRALTWRAGDILIYKTGSNNGNGDKSLTGHTAVLSNKENFVIEASKTGSHGAKVFHWNVSNLWSGASGIKQYQVTSMLGTPASSSEKQTAVAYGEKQVGKPYALKTTLFTDEAWYCSKLTFRQWLAAGYDLGGAMNFIHPIYAILLVTPNDIAIDVNTRIYKDWGTDLPKPL